MTPDERAFALHRAGPIGEAILRNLPAAMALPYAFAAERPARRGTMVCVGAGPSLDRTGPELARLQREGALILTVNTALPAVSKHVVPDVVLVREIVDVSSHLAHPAGLRVLDLGANHRVWEAAMRAGPCAWFVSGNDHLFRLARTIGRRPLFGGPAALTACVALAEEWGAAEIVLLGCDLAIAEGGASYASGSAFSGQRADIDEHGVAVNSGEGFAVKQRQHALAGVEAYPTREATAEVERWGGDGLLRTTTQWLPQIEWLASWARVRPGGVFLHDATGSGARKCGWFEEIVGHVEVKPGTRVAIGPVCTVCGLTHHARVHTVCGPIALARVRAHLLAEAEMLETVCANVVHPEGNPIGVPGILSGADFTETLEAGAVVLACEQSTGAEAIRRVYSEAYPRAAQRVREAISVWAA